MKKKVLSILVPVLFAVSAQADALKAIDNSNAAAKCQRLSDRASALGVNILVIGFEGAGQFSQARASELYSYQQLKALGREPKSLPRRGMWGALLTTGLLFPVAQKYGKDVEVLVFSNMQMGRFSSASAPVVCAQVWMKKAGRKLMITGHSAGAQAAQNLAAALNRKQVAVDSVYTIDPFFTNGIISKTANVKRWENFYQLLPSPLPGTPAASVDVDHNLTGRATHGSIPAHASVHKAVMSRLKLLTSR